jgi:hypothetical protein
MLTRGPGRFNWPGDSAPLPDGLADCFARDAKPLPAFAETTVLLPAPIYDENPFYVRMYWKAWELGFHNFYEPEQGSGFVSPFIDAAFNQDVFLWDSCFMSMFCNYADPLVPGISSLDNFYAKQYDDGEIGRQISRRTGRDKADWVNGERKDLFSRGDTWPGHREKTRFAVVYAEREVPRPPPYVMLDTLNHPLFAWAELEHVRVTGDRSRLKLVYEPLLRYYRALQKYPRQGNGLYMTDWASMDNSPRNPYLKSGGTAVDTSSEMMLYADQLASIADLIGRSDEALRFRREAAALARLINVKMWIPDRKFYFDLTVEGHHAPAKPIAAYWTLLAGVASPAQAEALAAELRNPRSFGRRHRVPTTPADQAGYDPAGGYWRGAVWSFTNAMVVRGLERTASTPWRVRSPWKICGRWPKCSLRRARFGRITPRTTSGPAVPRSRTSSAGRESFPSCFSSSTALA